ncbi:UNVERIFIED_CONTAM: hypothetical protein Sindi_0031600 [Sesamum indicum]
MSAKILPSSRHENRNSRKQIRCMNSIFHLFDRHHLLAGWKMSSHNHKRLLPGPQQELEPNKLKAVTNSMSTLKDQIPAFELAATMMEQPSPVSVLDATFYSEDSPSPVKKRSTAFQGSGLLP